ncbi:hypothetical protein D3C72_2156260 [compost metagenome]
MAFDSVRIKPSWSMAGTRCVRLRVLNGGWRAAPASRSTSCTVKETRFSLRATKADRAYGLMRLRSTYKIRDMADSCG